MKPLSKGILVALLAAGLAFSASAKQFDITSKTSIPFEDQEVDRVKLSLEPSSSPTPNLNMVALAELSSTGDNISASVRYENKAIIFEINITSGESTGDTSFTGRQIKEVNVTQEFRNLEELSLGTKKILIVLKKDGQTVETAYSGLEITSEENELPLNNENASYQTGDVNHDSLISNLDAEEIISYSEGENPEGTFDESLADVNGDGNISKADAMELMEMDDYVLHGDVNQNGFLNKEDIQAIQSSIVGNPPEEFNSTLADINDDGVIGPGDTVLVKGKIGDVTLDSEVDNKDYQKTRKYFLNTHMNKNRQIHGVFEKGLADLSNSNDINHADMSLYLGELENRYNNQFIITDINPQPQNPTQGLDFNVDVTVLSTHDSTPGIITVKLEGPNGVKEKEFDFASGSQQTESFSITAPYNETTFSVSADVLGFEAMSLTEEISTTTEGPMMGDVNEDGTVNLEDVNIVEGFILGQESGINQELADVDHDGDIDVSDALEIQYAVLEGETGTLTEEENKDNGNPPLTTDQKRNQQAEEKQNTEKEQKEKEDEKQRKGFSFTGFIGGLFR